MRVTASDWIPRYEHYGMTDIIRSILPQQLEFNSFVEQVNIKADKLQKGLLNLSNDMMNLLISDLFSSGKLKEIRFDGLPPEAVLVSRDIAPAGLGQDAISVFFGEPSIGSKEIVWYTNGGLKLSEVRDLTANRSVLKTQLETTIGDTVQIAYIDDNDLVSWWSGIEVV